MRRDENSLRSSRCAGWSFHRMVRSGGEYRWLHVGGRMSAVQSVLTATRVLERLSEPGLVGVSELSRDLALPKSSVQRMLVTLKEAGWAVDVRGETTRWTLTPKMFRLGQHHQAGDGLRSTALPVMEQL